MENEKILCEDCKKENAKWLYMPSSINGYDFLCDNCVPRGCIHCNYDEIERLDDYTDIEEKFKVYYKHNGKDYLKCSKNDAEYFEILDEECRQYPCIEYDYEENGFYKKDYEY